MAPIRRYLRITKYSVLECRIYLDNPALAESWLLNSRNPILPRVIESVRPLVLPKLREENERSKARGKKKSVKDVVVEGICTPFGLGLSNFSRGLRGLDLLDRDEYTTLPAYEAEALPRSEQEGLAIEFS
jgi:hypothetical protein